MYYGICLGVCRPFTIHICAYQINIACPMIIIFNFLCLFLLFCDYCYLRDFSNIMYLSEVLILGVSYRKLRIKLAELNLKPKDIVEKTGISWGSMTNINKDGYVNLRTLEVIARYLNCDIGDLVEIVDDKE